MRTFNVFHDAEGRARAVKQGWSWPAFFFGPLWALVSGIWLAALLILPLEFVINLVAGVAELTPYGSTPDVSQMAIVSGLFLIFLVIRLVFGCFGNVWKAIKLERQGFFQVASVKADGKAHALSLSRPPAPAPAASSPVAAPRRAQPEPVLTELRARTAAPTAAVPAPSHADEGQDDPDARAMDTVLLVLAALLGLGASLTVIGLVPVGILLLGLLIALKTGKRRYLKTATGFVSGLGMLLLVLSAGAGVVVAALYFGSPVAQDGYGGYGAVSLGGVVSFFAIAGLSVVGLAALRHLWLNPLLRQFNAIRAMVFGIRIPEMPRRPETQKIISRSGLQTYSVADEIAKWNALHTQGVINDEEYQSAAAVCSESRRARPRGKSPWPDRPHVVASPYEKGAGPAARPFAVRPSSGSQKSTRAEIHRRRGS